MFNNKEKGSEATTRVSGPTASNNNNYTRIGEAVNIKGDINCEGDVRVDGNVHGDITTTARVIIGPSGKVLGNITCNSAEIDGKMKGVINTSNLLSVTSNADIEGEVVTGRLSISDPKSFNVTSCKMQKGGAAPASTASTSTTPKTKAKA